ncbi:glycosyltransferase [Microbacterium maritypicum]
MRALIFTLGTRGDVDPYVALASRLQREGHAVTLSAPGVYREDLERRGIRFEPMGDAMHDEMRALMADSRGPVEAATLARRMSQAMRRSLSEQWTVAQKVDPTVIVSHPKALAGVHIAERLGIPFVASLPPPLPHSDARLRHPVRGSPISRTRQPSELSVQPLHGPRLWGDDQSVPHSDVGDATNQPDERLSAP